MDGYSGGYEYDAFISYRHKDPDMAVAKALHKQIETYGIPADIKKITGRTRMGRVFRDQEELPLMADLGEGIHRALEKSQWLILVCSPDLLQSRWCMAEVDYFIGLGRRDRILTLLVSGEPAESFPPQIRFVEGPQGMMEIEPLAADIRGGSLKEILKKLKTEKLRILAPMLGVPYDALRQRAKERRMKQLLAASTAALVFFAVFGGYSYYQAVQINRQRKLAMNNEMQLLTGRSVIAAQEKDRLFALDYALAALDRHDALFPEEETEYMAEIQAALEYASYNRSFQQLTAIKNNNMRIRNLIYSPDDRYILGICIQNSAALIDPANGEILYMVNNNREPLDQIGFSADGKYFFTACQIEGSVTVWETGPQKKMKATYKLGTDRAHSIQGVAFLGAENKLLLELPYGQVENGKPCLLEWDFTTNKTRVIADEKALPNSMFTQPAAVSGDGSMIVPSLDLPGPIILVETATGNTRELEQDDRGHRWFAFSPDDKYLIDATGDSVVLWDVATGKIVSRHVIQGTASDGFMGRYDNPPVYSPDGSLVAVYNSDQVTVLDAGTLKPKFTFGDNNANIIYQALFSPDGSLVVGLNNKIQICETATGQVVSTMDDAFVVSATFSHDGSRMIASTLEGANGVYSTPDSATVRVVSDFDGEIIQTPRWSDKGMTAVTSRHSYGDYFGAQPRMYMDETGRFIAMAYPDGFIEVWDKENSVDGEPVYGVAEHWLGINDIVIKDAVLVSASMEGRALVVDLETGAVRYALAVADQEQVLKVELNSDASLLIAMPYSGRRASVFSTRSGKLLFHLEGEKGAKITDVGFTADGKQAVALMDNGRAVVGQLFSSVDELAQHAKDYLGE